MSISKKKKWNIQRKKKQKKQNFCFTLFLKSNERWNVLHVNSKTLGFPYTAPMEAPSRVIRYLSLWHHYMTSWDSNSCGDMSLLQSASAEAAFRDTWNILVELDKAVCFKIDTIEEQQKAWTDLWIHAFLSFMTFQEQKFIVQHVQYDDD